MLIFKISFSIIIPLVDVPFSVLRAGFRLRVRFFLMVASPGVPRTNVLSSCRLLVCGFRWSSSFTNILITLYQILWILLKAVIQQKTTDITPIN